MIETGCLICNEELVYTESSSSMQCSVCGKNFESNASCLNNHFICDICHGSDAMDFIEIICQHSKSKNPIHLAQEIMNSTKVKMHGPEHHFLVPAVLITCYYNTINNPHLINKKLDYAKKRAKNVLGGFCGFHGACGAGIGTGIFMSVITNSTPLAKEEWRQSNLITAHSLLKIAEQGGPRCCKRDTYIALESAIDFVYKNMNVNLEQSEITCNYKHLNHECTLTECNYY